jgi:AraC-like DNA-binding protein
MAEQLQFRSLFRSPTVAVMDVRCRPAACACGPEEYSPDTTIVFPRSGAFVRHVGRERIVANCNHVLFFRAGETYRVSHPVPGGDDCTSLAFGREVLADAVSRFDPACQDLRDSPVGLTHGPAPSGLGYRVHSLRQQLRGGDADGLAVEEQALALLGAALGGAYRARGERPAREPRPAGRAQRERVEAVLGLLSARFREPLSLGEIARAVHYSPFHLARLFRREVGEPVHCYRGRLRLGAALERLAEGADDLTSLALGLGFSSHSHFTSAFRRAFGVPPSGFRSGLTPGRVRELSKNLKAGLPRCG